MPNGSETLKLAFKHHQSGDLQQAERLYRRFLDQNPKHAECLQLLGALHYQLKQYDEAIKCIAEAIALRGDQPHYHYNLGEAYRASHRIPEAKLCYERAVRIKPDYAVAYNNLGTTCLKLERFEEAKDALEKAVDLKPDFYQAWDQLGLLHQLRGKSKSAQDCYRRALQADPNYAPAHNNLGNLLSDSGRLQEAYASYEQALRCDPQCAGAQANVANVLRKQGRGEEAVAAFYKAAALDPTSAIYHANALRCEQYRVGVTAESLAARHAEFAEIHAKPLKRTWQKHNCEPNPDRPLRLGFVSMDFHRHPITYLSVRILENLDRSETELVFYYCDQKRVDMTARLQSLGRWRDVSNDSDEMLADQIRRDGIDILFNMAGLDRILVFARKPAPLQISWLGYVGSTGLDAMDYVLGVP